MSTPAGSTSTGISARDIDFIAKEVCEPWQDKILVGLE
jgi:hypothetical protein